MTRTEQDSLRARRLLQPVVARQAGNLFEVPSRIITKKKLKEWIGTHTTGEFYLCADVLYFLNDKDAMAFTLYDVRNKIDTE